VASRTNVNDRHFLDDIVYNEDYRRDVNAAEQGVREAVTDICGPGAVIFEGLTVEDSTAAGKFKVNPGRARDKDKRHAVLTSVINNIEPADSTAANYIAIRHKWSASNAANAVKTGRPYNRARAEGYELDVSRARHDEADGWANLARAEWNTEASGFDYHTDYPDRSRGPARDVAFWTFTYPGVLVADTTNALMEHHGVNKDVFAVPFDLVIHRLTFNARVVGAVDIKFALFDPQTATWISFDVCADDQLPVSFFNSWGFAEYYANDKLKIALTNESGSGGPEDISVVVAGYRVG
jgi:hypothetical protein